jgi:hypothetical protein
MDTKQFARRLWGDMYFHEDTRVFRKKPPAGRAVPAYRFSLHCKPFVPETTELCHMILQRC